MGLFNPESGFWKGVAGVADIFLLSLCWFVCSIPIVTIGAASTALYDAVAHTFRFKEGGTYARFFRTFKNEFKLSTMIWLFWAIIWASIYYLLSFISRLLGSGETGALFGMAGLIFMLLPTGVICWVFPILSRFTYDFASLNKTAVAFAGVHIVSTLILGIATALTVYLCAWLWLPIFIMPALLALFSSIFLEKAFKKHMDT